jgi:uncharacterized membrane protein YciS (DUF1049 family)
LRAWNATLFFAFSVVLHLMLLLLILPSTLSTNHSKHVETSYIVLKLTFSFHNISWHLVLQFVISVANTKCKKQCSRFVNSAVAPGFAEVVFMLRCFLKCLLAPFHDCNADKTYHSLLPDKWDEHNLSTWDKCSRLFPYPAALGIIFCVSLLYNSPVVACHWLTLKVGYRTDVKRVNNQRNHITLSGRKCSIKHRCWFGSYALESYKVPSSRSMAMAKSTRRQHISKLVF